MGDTLNAIQEQTKQIVALEITVESLKVDLNKLSKLIIGNGDEGIVTKVKELQTWKTGREWMQRAITVFIIGDILLRISELLFPN